MFCSHFYFWTDERNIYMGNITKTSCTEELVAISAESKYIPATEYAQCDAGCKQTKGAGSEAACERGSREIFLPASQNSESCFGKVACHFA